jgi:hypothetical protein
MTQTPVREVVAEDAMPPEIQFEMIRDGQKVDRVIYWRLSRTYDVLTASGHRHVYVYDPDLQRWKRDRVQNAGAS